MDASAGAPSVCGRSCHASLAEKVFFLCNAATRPSCNSSWQVAWYVGRAKLCGPYVSLFVPYLYSEQVLLVTQDGRVLVGVLCGYDSNGTLILSSCVERIFSPDEPVEEVPLGVYIIRGDSMYVYLLTDMTSALVGPLDPALDRAMPLSSLHAEPMPAVRHY